MKKLVLIVSLITFSIFAIPQQELPPPYDKAEILPFCSHGFYLNEHQLAALIASKNIKTIVEVGCWLGLSTRHLARCLPKDGTVYAVDHWKGSSEHQPGQTYWIPQLPQLYEYFLSNAIQEGVAHKIVPVRMDSLEAAQTLHLQVDLIYIDASHDTESVYRDIVAWYPHLNADGVMCGDDWGWGSIQVAVNRFAKERGLQIKASGNFWELVK